MIGCDWISFMWPQSYGSVGPEGIGFWRPAMLKASKQCPKGNHVRCCICCGFGAYKHYLLWLWGLLQQIGVTRLSGQNLQTRENVTNSWEPLWTSCDCPRNLLVLPERHGRKAQKSCGVWGRAAWLHSL